MPVSINFGGGNEYVDDAERARREAGSGSGGLFGGASPIAVVLDVLGIGKQVAREGNPSETGDLASQDKGPVTQETEVTDKKGNVLDVVEQTIQEVGQQTDVQRLPLAPLELDPLPMMTSGQTLPRPLTRIDPNSAF